MCHLFSGGYACNGLLLLHTDMFDSTSDIFIIQRHFDIQNLYNNTNDLEKS